MFLAEVDNISFQLGLGEQRRGRVERAGHILLTAAEKRSMSRTKTAHILCVMVCVIVSIALMNLPCSFVYGFIYAGRTPSKGQDQTNACGFGGLTGTFFAVVNWGWISALAELLALEELTPRKAAVGIGKGLGAGFVCIALFTLFMG